MFWDLSLTEIEPTLCQLSRTVPTFNILHYLSTLMRYQKYAFLLSFTTRRLIWVYTTVLMRFRLATLRSSKTTELHFEK